MQNLEHGTLVYFLLPRDYSAEKAAEEIDSRCEVVTCLFWKYYRYGIAEALLFLAYAVYFLLQFCHSGGFPFFRLGE